MMAPDQQRPDARPLRVVVELNSVDLRVGAVNDALDLAELASPAGVRFLLCGPLSSEFREEAARRGIATRRAASRVISRRGMALYVIDVLRWMVRLFAWRADVVHLNYPGYAPSMACAAWLCGIPVVARVGPFFPENLANRWVSAYVANCQAHATDLLCSPLHDRVVVTGDLFRADRVRQTMAPERSLPARREGLVRIVFLGQLVERKGLDVLIEAFARVGVPAELLIAGGDWSAPGYPAQLRTLAHQLGVADRIHFENHRRDVGAVLSTADIFVLPSRSDARPRSIIEAMSLGIPVVASEVGGIPSLVQHEQTGLLVPAEDAGALAAALAKMIESPALRKRMGAAGRLHAGEACRPDLTALEYVGLYRRLLAGELQLPGRVTSMVARARS
jgi:glycosyltransferase involved in cell wall biosynthesis